MLKIVVPGSEWFNAETDEFIYMKEQVLLLEHSLMSISKWESKWKKPFISKKPKSRKENLDYIRCMTISKGIDPKIYVSLPTSVINEVAKYIDDPMTATWFPKSQSKPSTEIITAERVYCWMISLGIPFECEKWHFNKLMTLIRVCIAENNKGQKMSRKEIAEQNKAINDARRARFHSKG